MGTRCEVYNIGYAWGGSEHDFEIWVDWVLVSGVDLPAGVSLPWGATYLNSGINFGLGDNHERGYDVYGSAAGVSFADIHIWDEYRAQGDTIGPTVESALSSGTPHDIFQPGGHVYAIGRSGYTPGIYTLYVMNDQT